MFRIDFRIHYSSDKKSENKDDPPTNGLNRPAWATFIVVALSTAIGWVLRLAGLIPP